MADLATSLLAGLIGGTFSGSLSGVLVFEYQTRRRRHLDVAESRNSAIALLEQVVLLARGPQARLAATRRNALQALLGELARALPSLAAGLPFPKRHAFQAVLLQLGDAVAAPTTRPDDVAKLARDGLVVLRA